MAGRDHAQELAALRARIADDVAALRRWPEETRRSFEAVTPAGILREVAGGGRAPSFPALGGLAVLGALAVAGLVWSRRSRGGPAAPAPD